MSVINQNLLLTPEGYQISRSVRLRSSATAYFNRTFSAAPTVRTKQTVSAWIKRGSLGANQGILSGYDGTSASRSVLYFSSTDQLAYDNGGAAAALVASAAVYRDPSAWYHIVLSIDTTQATAANRVLLYVNGVQLTSFASSNYPAQNATTQFALNTANNFIGELAASNWYFDGYLTEVNFIDGQALTPSSFGETDVVTGVWKPKKYAGTYGTNGFYLNFSDNSAATAAAIGKDSSGNGNNWTPNNISVTAGVTYDSMLDVPTMWADGGNGRGNYAVLNPLSTLAAGATVSGANLNIVGASASAYGSPATMLLTSGKWYFEVTAGSVASRYPVVGVQTELTAFLSSGFPGGYTANGFGYGSDGNKFVNNGAATAFGSTFTSGDVIGVAIDIDAGKVWLAKNNTWQASGDPAAGTNAAYSPTAGTPLYPCVGTYNGAGTHSANFGQRPFAYTPPTGFKALNTQNLPDATIKKGNAYFDALTWTGDGTSPKSRTGYGFQPDLVWAKGRSASHDHALFDAVRGTGAKVLSSNSTSAENDYGLSVVSFDANGFTTQTGSLNHSYANTNGSTYVGWAWKESASAGFDIVTYSGTGAAQTVAHSLGVAPRMIIAKRRNGAQNWFVGHGSFASWSSAIEGLNTTAAVNNGATAVWNATAPTSSVFSVGTDLSASGGTYVAYLFAEVAGFSKFGGYTGNGSADGVFVYLGFRPKYFMFKRTDTAADWQVWDSSRDTSNVVNNVLLPNSSTAESGSQAAMDFTANGVKFRSSSVGNNSGGTYIFAAFAENPFKNSLAR